MKDLKGISIGFAVTGSFCTFGEAFEQARILRDMGAKLVPVMSENAASISTRFGEANRRIEELSEICGCDVMSSIAAAEPIGPNKMCDIMLVCPCTGNTMAKLAGSITDTSVAHKRNRNLQKRMNTEFARMKKFIPMIMKKGQMLAISSQQ